MLEARSVIASTSRSRSLAGAKVAREPSAPLATTPAERCGADDRFHDYVLAEYEPAAPALGKLRSLNVLVESFAVAGLEAEGVALMNAVRTQLGPFRTVWGIKRDGASGDLRWELYFYDFDRRHADLSIERVTAILSPFVKVEGREPRPLPWHMFSVELGRAQLREGQPAPVDIYLDMRSYKVVGERLLFENVYTFHDARSEIDEVLHRLRSSIHFDPRSDGLHQLMPPHLFQCRKICVANKREADALYFSRITTPALARFLRDHRWPDALQRYVDGRDDELNHLRWDVGVDFRAVDGRATPLKTGIYGSF